MATIDDQGTTTLDRWPSGAPLERTGLADELAEVWATAAALVGRPTELTGTIRDVESAQARVDEASSWLVAVLEDDGGRTAAVDAGELGTAARSLVRLARLSASLRQLAADHQSRAYAAVTGALERLRRTEDPEQLVRSVPAEIARCGFDRAMVTRVEGDRGIVEAFHAEGVPSAADELLRVGREQPMRLDHTLLETEMVRRRTSLLVLGARDDPRTHAALVRVSGSRSYVAAPIVCRGTVVGFVHADRHGQRRDVDALDRDVLRSFAEGLGAALERADLRRRIADLARDVRRTNASVLDVMDVFYEAQLEVSAPDTDTDPEPSPSSALPEALRTANPRTDGLLTQRELDVLRLVAAGETNAAIAVRLVVSEGTVKSHVKNILRKLRANNRAEAVSRYVRLTRSDG